MEKENNQAKAPINIFWNWFRDNKNEISDLPNLPPRDQAGHLYWLNINLKYYSPLIDLVLIFPKGKSKPQMIFSTSSKKAFQDAVRLINHAPKRIKWSIRSVELTAVDAEGFAILQEPTLSIDAGNKYVATIDSKKHLHVLFKNEHVFCYYVHLCYLGQLFDSKKILKDTNSFVQIPISGKRSKTPIKLYEFQFLLDEYNRHTRIAEISVNELKNNDDS